uniref:Uncharacterized protein n=1 Tax=Cacopsylla melanoneura TaxID=428564 RepID=A0A8D8XJA1_9HEMI
MISYQSPVLVIVLLLSTAECISGLGEMITRKLGTIKCVVKTCGTWRLRSQDLLVEFSWYALLPTIWRSVGRVMLLLTLIYFRFRSMRCLLPLNPLLLPQSQSLPPHRLKLRPSCLKDLLLLRWRVSPQKLP